MLTVENRGPRKTRPKDPAGPADPSDAGVHVRVWCERIVLAPDQGSTWRGFKAYDPVLRAR